VSAPLFGDAGNAGPNERDAQDKKPPKGMTARLFLGTYLAENDRCALAQLREDVNDSFTQHWRGKLRWVHRDKLHLTWAFIGSVPQSQISEIQQALDGILAEPPDLKIVFDRAQLWPNTRRPQQLVLTSSSVSSEILSFAARIKNASRPYMEKAEERLFKPHITILRFGKQDSPSRHQREIPESERFERLLPLIHTIDRVDMIQSHLGKAGGDAYETLHTWNWCEQTNRWK
jgi:RNA 2',3'-cyclic 3'-phosphodiesterase